VRAWLERVLGGHEAAADARWVVVDCETTGLDPHRDSLVSLAAVGVRGRRIGASDWFEVTVRPSARSARENILLHGIGRGRQEAGETPVAALATYLQFASNAPRVAFRAAFDRVVIGRALHAVGRRDAARWLDLAELLPVLFPRAAGKATALDTWLAEFEIDHRWRHDALGDAYATAQLFQIALGQAIRQGFRSVAGVLRAAESGRWTGG